MKNIFREVIKFFLITSLFILPKANAQEYFRLKTDFSVKEIDGSRKKKLTLGTVYYDINAKQIVMDLQFPNKEILVFKDSLLYTIRDNKVVSTKRMIDGFVNSSFYHLLLTNKISDFGLSQGEYYKKGKVDFSQGNIITEWLPAGGLEKITGKIFTMNNQNRITGILFYNKEEELLNKQVFGKYEFINGLNFPTEVIMQYFSQRKEGIIELTKLYTYKNVVINEISNNDFYNYTIPN